MQRVFPLAVLALATILAPTVLAGCDDDAGDAATDGVSDVVAVADVADATGPLTVLPDGLTSFDAASDVLADAARPDTSADASVDGGVDGDAASDADGVDAGPPPPPPEPLRIAFIGNSFTFGGPVPDIVDTLANDAGWPDPEVDSSTFGGESLLGHQSRQGSLDLIDAGSWDVVVLQENSVRPTDALGNPPQFKSAATWWHDRIKATSPDAQVILYETWARHPDHGYYPGTFADPAEMQAQLRFHYNDAAVVYIPANAALSVIPPSKSRRWAMPGSTISRSRARCGYITPTTGTPASAVSTSTASSSMPPSTIVPWQG